MDLWEETPDFHPGHRNPLTYHPQVRHQTLRLIQHSHPSLKDLEMENDHNVLKVLQKHTQDSVMGISLFLLREILLHPPQELVMIHLQDLHPLFQERPPRVYNHHQGHLPILCHLHHYRSLGADPQVSHYVAYDLEAIYDYLVMTSVVLGVDPQQELYL